MPVVPRTVAPQALRDVTPQQSVHAQDVRVGALPHTLRGGEELVLSRWHMQRPKLTVSREQCKVMVAADGTADLVSCGKGPTLLRQSGAPWYAVSRSDTCPLAHGDQISLDCNDPEAAVFTCEVSILTTCLLWPYYHGYSYYCYTCSGYTYYHHPGSAVCTYDVR